MKNKALKIITTLMNICLLRESPSHLPYSIFTLMTFILLEFIWTAINLSKIKGATLPQEIITAFFIVAIFIALVALLLKQRKLSERIPKTLLALFGAELLLRLLFNSLITLLPATVAIMIMYSLWVTVVKAYILKEAIMVKMPVAILWVLGIHLLAALPIWVAFNEQLLELQQLQQSQLEGT